jgi:hypothetical protein
MLNRSFILFGDDLPSFALDGGENIQNALFKSILANDFMYGTEVPGEEGHALHAFRLEIGGDRPLTVTCPVPERFSHYMDMDVEKA